MTSNIGSQAIQEIHAKGEANKKCARPVLATLQTRFLPEFLNRIDETIIFHPLDRQQLHHIVELQVAAVAEAARAERSRAGSDGRRSRRYCTGGLRSDLRCTAAKATRQQRILNPLASELLKGRFPPQAA